MLDYMRRNAQSIVIVFVLSILILAFIIEFGPQSRGCRSEGGPAQHSARTVLTVHGYEVTDLEFEFWRRHLSAQPGMPMGDRYYPCYRTAMFFAQMARRAGDGAGADPLGEADDDAAHYRNAFVIREALVREARRFGVAIDDEEIKGALSRGRIFIFDHGSWTDLQGGVHYCGGDLPLLVGIGRNGKFDPNVFRAALQQTYQMSVDDYYAFQRRNLVALKMQQILAAGVGASTAEAEAEIRAAAEAIDLLVWIVGPAIASDADTAAHQAKFDEFRAAVADADVERWLADSAHAREVDDLIGRAAAPPPGDAAVADPQARKRELARSLIAVGRMTEEVRLAARVAGAAFAEPAGAPDDPPPAPPGLEIRSHMEQFYPLRPLAALPQSLADDPDRATALSDAILALTADAPVLAEEIEQEAKVASVKDAAGQDYALRQILLVRRTGPWNLEAAGRIAVREKGEAAAATFLAVKRARELEAWYATELFHARAADRVDEQGLLDYLDALRRQQAE